MPGDEQDPPRRPIAPAAAASVKMTPAAATRGDENDDPDDDQDPPRPAPSLGQGDWRDALTDSCTTSYFGDDDFRSEAFSVRW